ncbi:DUF742 domain-containing protein [Streptomyces sp. NPDC017673]|uniref:DUF742 domain-containing protein n=1 Tax=unclassified Streptomyces TaxID=2593676 RepID=UPI0037A7EC35
MPEFWPNGETVALVRPYTLVRGRTLAHRGTFDLVTYVVAMVRSLYAWDGVEPEHGRLLNLCQRPRSVSEITARMHLPLGVVRVLLGDLLDMDVIRISRPLHADGRPDIPVIQQVLEGLRAL